MGTIYKIRRRCRRYHDIGDITPYEYIEIAWHTHCVYCGQERKQDEKLTVDHIIPVRLGGANSFENIVPACHSCNASKGDQPVIEFYFRSDKFTDELFRDFIRYTAEKADRDESAMLTWLYDWHHAEKYGYIPERVQSQLMM